MKSVKLTCVIATLAILIVGSTVTLRAADTNSVPAMRFEYATIHWDGRDNTHVIFPNGVVKCLGPQLTVISKPSRTDERAFYMNLAINSLAKEGYEFAGIRDNDVIMKRVAPPQ